MSSPERLLNLLLNWFSRSSTTATRSEGAVSEAYRYIQNQHMCLSSDNTDTHRDCCSMNGNRGAHCVVGDVEFLDLRGQCGVVGRHVPGRVSQDIDSTLVCVV